MTMQIPLYPHGNVIIRDGRSLATSVIVSFLDAVMSITCSYEKQDILYNKIRHCLGQEKLTRILWYDVEPHSKKKNQWIHFDTFTPDNSKSKYPIESLVLSERYSCDEPLDIRECPINEFWDYLFSEDWSEGSSLRVLKGRLQDQIVICLAHMKKVGIITHHRTYACAVNLRRKQCKMNQNDTPVNNSHLHLPSRQYFDYQDYEEKSTIKVDDLMLISVYLVVMEDVGVNTLRSSSSSSSSSSSKSSSSSSSSSSGITTAHVNPTTVQPKIPHLR